MPCPPRSCGNVVAFCLETEYRSRMTETIYRIGKKELTLKQMDVRQMTYVMETLVDSLDDSSPEKRTIAKNHLKTIIAEIKFRLGTGYPYIIIFNRGDDENPPEYPH